jgi:RNA methyltransferase, TrmH family
VCASVWIISMVLKNIRKLADRKYRDETGLFLVEGKKSISELLESDFEVESIFVTQDASIDMRGAIETYCIRAKKSQPEVVIVSEEKLSTIGTFQSNNAGVAVVRRRTSTPPSNILKRAQTEFVLVLDDVRDPGNLGTIVRIADWFGVTHIVTSETTTDFYNPKTVSASMGSFTRVHVTPLSLPEFLQEAKRANILSYGTFLDGKSIYEYKKVDRGLLIMGSESHGISEELEALIHERITIPRYGKAESLNVGIATAIILSALRQ